MLIHKLLLSALFAGLFAVSSVSCGGINKVGTQANPPVSVDPPASGQFTSDPGIVWLNGGPNATPRPTIEVSKVARDIHSFLPSATNLPSSFLEADVAQADIESAADADQQQTSKRIKAWRKSKQVPERTSVRVTVNVD